MALLKGQNGFRYERKKLEEIINEKFIDLYEPPHQLGPDHVLAADKYTVSDPETPVKLRLSESGSASRKPLSLVTFIKKTKEKSGDKIAMSVKRDGEWNHWTYNKYWEEIQIVAKAFIKLGLERFHCVAILGFNSPEWFLANHGAIFAGGISTGIYTTNSSTSCEYILQHCRTDIIVVDNEVQLNKIIPFMKNLKHLKAVIQYTGKISRDEVLSWDDVLKIGKSVPDEILERRIKSLAVNQCCSIIYTSGTTGPPKAVMLCPDNYVYLICEHGDCEFQNTGNDFSMVSYLPLSHIAAQFIELYAPFFVAAQVYFAQPDAFKGSLVETLKEAEPTVFVGVPRVFEKMKESLEDHLSRQNWLVSNLIWWSMGLMQQYVRNRMEGKNPTTPYGYTLAKRVTYLIRKRLGLNNVIYCGCGGASLSREVVEFFLGLDLAIIEGYGLSETTGAHIFNPINDRRLFSVGKKNERNDTKLINVDSEGYGEICLRGRNVFMGYMYDDAKNKEALDADGWLHTGDVGYLNKDDYLFITGRIKELIITSGGENVAPVPIENAVKQELPCISQAVVIGDKRKFLSMLLTMKTNIDVDTFIPLDTLTEASLQWCRSVGSNSTTITEILKGPDAKVMAAIQNGIDQVNKKSVSNACKIQKWALLPRDFVVEDELSSTLKLKRFVINEKYKDIIDKFYK